MIFLSASLKKGDRDIVTDMIFFPYTCVHTLALLKKLTDVDYKAFYVNGLSNNREGL